MRYDTRYRTRYSDYFPTGVKWLLISNVAVFLLTYLMGLGSFRIFFLVPVAVTQHFAIWQLVTYLFLHGGVWHLLMNMFTLWMFGTTLERDWGTRQFLKYYFLCGVGAGICDVLVNTIIGNRFTSTIGASGAIYGLLLAFGVMYPNTTVLFNFLFPIKAKYFVMIYGAIALLSSLNVNSGVSNVAHLGGMLFGLLYLKARVPRLSFNVGSVRRRYQQWKLQRAKRKFQVYLRKHGSGGRGPWTQ